MYYLIYKKNINMNPSKVAYEILQLSNEQSISPDDSVTILGVSTTKFKAVTEEHQAKTRNDGQMITCAAIFSEQRIKL